MAPRFAPICALVVAAGAEVVQAVTLQPNDDPAPSPIWQKVRASLYERRAAPRWSTRVTCASFPRTCCAKPRHEAARG